MIDFLHKILSELGLRRLREPDLETITGDTR